MGSAKSAKAGIVLGASLVAVFSAPVSNAERHKADALAITGSGVDAITGSGVSAITGSGVGAITGSGLYAITGSGVNAITGSGVGAITGSGVGAITGSGVDAITGSGVDAITGSGVGAITGSGVDAITGSGVDAITGSGVDAITGSGVGAITGSGVDAITGSGVDAITGSGVGAITGSGVDAITGSGQPMLAGPVSAINLAENTFTAVGQTVSFFGSFGNLTIGDYVTVYGSISGAGQIQATGVEVLSDMYVAGASEVFVTGIPSSVDYSKARVRIGDLNIDYAMSLGDFGVGEIGAAITVYGTQPALGGTMLGETVIDKTDLFLGD